MEEIRSSRDGRLYSDDREVPTKIYNREGVKPTMRPPTQQNRKAGRTFGKFQFRLLWTALWMIFTAVFSIYFNEPKYLFMLFIWFFGYLMYNS